jgi:hypothetical protein
MHTEMADHGLLAGNSLPTKLPMAAGSCSPAPPTKVYERSKPAGPSTFISHLSLAWDPTMDTRHSPGLSLSTCSKIATISPRTRGSPVFCISILTAMSSVLYKAPRQTLPSCRTDQREQARHFASNSPLYGRWLSNRTATLGVPEALKRGLKEGVGGVGPSSILVDELVKWSFTIRDEKDVRRRMLFLGDEPYGSKERRKKEKGCDIGYALATSSCERANSVDACTVTAF